MAVVHAGPNDSWHGVIKSGGQFPPEAGRYHLYVGLFCPFAHRALLVRHLKGLESLIDLSVVMPYPKVDKLFASSFLHEVYFKADPGYAGRYSVPVLWDVKTGAIVNNESAELLRWLPTAFNDILPQNEQESQLDLYPAHLRSEIDTITEWMQRDLNSGVYTAGFAETQEAYNEGVLTVFASLNHFENLIHRNGGPYILGKHLTELDIRAYTTIIRFDAIYVQHFKCNLGTIRANYPVIHEWLKNLYWNVKGFRETTDFQHIKENYTKSHAKINPLAITPLGPFPDVEEGVDLNFAQLKPGSVRHPLVLERQAELYN
ncbi:glutathione S-transferase [Trichoderma chlorosporum]